MLVNMSSFDLDDRRPAYVQVADKLRAAINSGELAPGDQLPTQQTLSTEYGIAVETAKRALGLLRSEGLVVSHQGKGSFVRKDPPADGRSAFEASSLAARIDDLNAELVAVKRRLDALENGESTGS
jgi:DNA-binding GntR family transcriptional regulator